MNLIINTQSQLDAALATEVVNGNLVINDLDTPFDEKITSLAWPNLKVINGNLQLTGLGQLQNLSATSFPNLETVANIFIENCQLLNILSDSFQNIVGLDTLSVTNTDLFAVLGFQNLTNLNFLSIIENKNLEDVSGLCSLAKINSRIDVLKNPLLQNVDSFSNIEPSNNPTFVVSFLNNESLDRFCGLNKLAIANTSDAFFLSGNLSNPSREQIAAGGVCEVQDFIIPPDVSVFCGDSTIIIPKESATTGKATAKFAKSITCADSFIEIDCQKDIMRNWTATSFANVPETRLQRISDFRNCELTFACPDDYTVKCTDKNLCPNETTGNPVISTPEQTVKVDYLDFVFKRSRINCKPLIIKRRWKLVSNCPTPNTELYCVQTITVPCNWPHFKTCGFVPTKFC